MPPVRVKYVISFTSQAPKNTVEDLVKGRGSWLCEASDRTGRLQADIQLERATTISYIDLGNAGSVMVSIEVGRSSWPSDKPFMALLPTVALMTPAEWRAGKNSKTVRMFKKEDLDQNAVKEKWDRVRIICTQPFRKDAQFGLALFCLHTTDESHVQDEVSAFNPHRVLPHGTQSDMKKEELVSRMNLPTVKKKVMSQSIGWLENKVLTNGEEANASNPFTSPVSRAARLVVMATKPANKGSVTSHKASLECEALDFLISLNLNIEDINSLKVSGVRQQFEQHRQKMLNHDEKMIFKDIALDYAKNRLESLEKKVEKAIESDTWKNKGTSKKQQKQLKKEKENKFKGNIPKQNMSKNSDEEKRKTLAAMSKQINKPANLPVQKSSHGKFTFKKIEAPGSSLALLKKSPVSRKEHQKSDNDLKTRSPSGFSRNELALSDAKVTTPKSSRGRPKKSVTPKMRDSKQPTVNTWITPVGKRKREESHDSDSAQASQKFSKELDDISSGLIWTDSDDDDDVNDKKQGGGFMDDTTSLVIPRHTQSSNVLGTAPSDKFGMTQARKKSRGGSSDHTQSAVSSNSHSSTMMECPLCSGFFHPSKIQSHASSCGIVISSDSDSDSDCGYRSNSGNEQNKRGSLEECPVCGEFINSLDLQEHAAECANSTFG
ncbi:uncharacterized protein LOC125031152 isoform X2 [Penaeus chinensis]|uniref:uncharacterized protein LOC125031152 isoform X2 n=1 Tax=Penaeus chinensis TaxID=139456 RepID=UPI001FB6D31C|nr:uncharacterized protein LOC125031152 isoform X2 [Penaeus chinensis]